MDELNQIAEASYLPILMLTGDDTPEAKREALSRGAKDFLNKPFHSDEVLLRIGTLLETRFLYLQIQSQNQMLEAKVRDRTRELEAAQIEIIERLARAAEFRDDNTGQHTERVGQMAALLAQADRPAGHAGVADPPRGAAARRRQDRHPGFGPAEARKADAGGVRAGQDPHDDRRAHPVGQPLHHPEARRGDRLQPPRAVGRQRLRRHRRRRDIPLAGRIVAVADVFDALTQKRPYKAAWPVGDAIAEIERQRGRQFDPALVDAFLRVIEQREPQTPVTRD